MEEIALSTRERLRFRIKSGDFEVELEGNSEYVKPTFESLLNDIYPKAKPLRPSVSAPVSVEVSGEEFPATIVGRIEYLVKTGFFDQPQKLSNIVEELARRGFPYDVKTVDNALRKLLRKMVIRRLGVRGRYEYVIK